MIRTLARFRTLIQVCDTWDVDWTTIEGAWASRNGDGFCNDLGSAEIVYRFGNIQRRLTNTVSNFTPLEVTGLYVRVCEISEGGSVVADDGETFQPVWVGVCGESSFTPVDDGYEQRISVQGILTVLDMVTPTTHFAVSKGKLLAADAGFEAAFNIVGDKKTGNRSANKYDFGGGYSAYVFDTSGDGEDWTAFDAVEYALALAYWHAPGGPTFVPTGQLSALQFKDKYSIAGLSCLEIIAKVMNKKQGVGFRAGYDGSSSVLIDVMSLSPDEITVPGGATVPASNRKFTLDLTPEGYASKWKVRENQKAAYDNINVVMGKNRYAVTLTLDHVEPDWSADDRTAFDNADEDDAARNQLAIAKVGRRFKLKSTWDGSCQGGFILPNSRDVVTSVLHGSDGYDGELSNTGDLLEPGGFRFLKNLPMPEGYDWTTAPSTPDKTRDTMKPMVFVKPHSASTYETLAEYLGIDDIDFKVDEDSASFTIGPAKVAQNVLDLIDEGASFFFTVGIEAPMHTILSWRRPAASVPRDKRRIMTKTREKLLRRFIAAGTYLGCEEGMIKSNATEIVVEDDIALARTLLATLTPWYSVSDWSFSRTLEGVVVLPEDFITGDMITEASYQFIDGSTKTVSATAVISSIERDYENGSVALNTERIAVDVEAIS